MKSLPQKSALERVAGRLTGAALAACGPLAALALIAADRLGAMSTPGYSSTAQPISELVAIGAAQKSLVDPYLLLFHGLAIPFAAGLYLALRPGRHVATASRLLAAAGVAGVILTLFLPCDPGCESFVSLRGSLHVAVAVPMGFAILFAILFFGRALRRRPRWRKLGIYSIVTASLCLALAAATILNDQGGWVGAMERALTLGYIQWYAIVGSVFTVEFFAAGAPEEPG